MRTNEPNIAKPTVNAATFVVQTGGGRMSWRSTSGSVTRHSHAAQSTASTAEAANRPSTPAEVQPHVLPSLTPSSSAPSAPDIKTPPSQSIRASTRTGDSGTYFHVAQAAI